MRTEHNVQVPRKAAQGARKAATLARPLLRNSRATRQIDVSHAQRPPPRPFTNTYHHVQHYITGAVKRASQGSAYLDTVLDSAHNYATPSTITPNSSSSLASSMTWNTFLGLTSRTDPNTAQTAVYYDSAGRIYYTRSPKGVLTYYSYTYNPTSVIANTNGRYHKAYYDGFGREKKTELTYSTSVYSRVDYRYGDCPCSPLGKLSQKSYPFTDTGLRKWITYGYDARGRTVTVTQPDSYGATTYIYEGNTVKVVDAENRWKKFTVDSFGNLVQVTEPRPGGGTYETYYTYNLRNQLTQVSMPRDGVTQTRTFVYDGNGRLTQTTFPESGARTYTYNSDGQIATKTDANGWQLNYYYDALHRLVQVGRTNGGTEVRDSYIYGDTVGGTGNSYGRLRRLEYATHGYSGDDSWTEEYSYTSAGSIASKALSGTRLGSATLTATYGYDNEERLSSIGYPEEYDPVSRLWFAGPTFGISYDNEGRPYRLLETSGSTTTPGWAQVQTWTPDGLPLASLFLKTRAEEQWQDVKYKEERAYNTIGQLTSQKIYELFNPTNKLQDIEYWLTSVNNTGLLQARQNNIRVSA